MLIEEGKREKGKNSFRFGFQYRYLLPRYYLVLQALFINKDITIVDG